MSLLPDEIRQMDAPSVYQAIETGEFAEWQWCHVRPLVRRRVERDNPLWFSRVSCGFSWADAAHWKGWHGDDFEKWINVVDEPETAHWFLDNGFTTENAARATWWGWTIGELAEDGVIDTPNDVLTALGGTDAPSGRQTRIFVPADTDSAYIVWTQHDDAASDWPVDAGRADLVEEALQNSGTALSVQFRHQNYPRVVTIGAAELKARLKELGWVV